MKILLLFFAVLQKIFAQETHKELKFDVQEVGKIEKDGDTLFYKLIIPPNVLMDSSNIILRIKETDLADEAKEDFSDPDIYVSKVTIY
jgi:hypothetical protein